MHTKVVPSVNTQQLDSSPLVEVRALLPGDDATAFRTLNEEWITRHFTWSRRTSRRSITRKARSSTMEVRSTWLTPAPSQSGAWR